MGETCIGRYRLRREIGRGAFAVVYEAWDPRLSRRVALKVLTLEESVPSVVQRLRREGAIAAQFQHPNIVAVHEAGTAVDPAGRPVYYIAMDFIEGRTLDRVLRDERPPVAGMLHMLEELARAAHQAHERGVVHRDLKPENAIVDGTGRVLLLDFGIAHAGLFRRKLTVTGDMIGTPHYMAPEQIDGGEVDPRTDVYALGVILYQALTGRMPFDSPSVLELLSRIVRESPDPPRASPDLDRVCLKAMARDRADRYETALLFAEDLARVRHGDPPLARPPSTVRRIGRAVFRRRSWLAVGGVAALLLALVAARDADRPAIEVRPDLEAILRRELEAERLSDAADRAIRENNWPAAEAALRALLVDAPGRPGARFRLAQACARLGKLDEALAFYADEPSADSSLGRGFIFVRRQDWTSAIGEFGEAIRLRPEQPVAYAQRGMAREAIRDYANAEADLAKALTLAPETWPQRASVEKRLASVRKRM